MSSTERVRKSRRKHKNSKLGCEQCKERRMKCNEELPACRNCTVRQVNIPCSYLSFTEEEKKEFLRKKALQSSGTGTETETTPITPLSSTSPNDSQSTPQSRGSPTTLKLVKHVKPSYLKSQIIQLKGESEYRLNKRIYFISYINNQYFKLDHAFNSFLSLPSLWVSIKLQQKLELMQEQVHSDNNNEQDEDEDEDEEDKLEKVEQLSKEIESLRLLSIHYKTESLMYLRTLVASAIEGLSDEKTRERAIKFFDQMALPSFILQSVDVLSLDTLKFYYITGSQSLLREFFKSPDEVSPLSKFVASSIIVNYNALFIPNYPKDFLYGFLETLEEYKPFILSTNDKQLAKRYNDLKKYVKEDVLDVNLDNQYNPNFVISYEAKKLYDLQYRFVQLLAGDTYTINSQSSIIHKIFYSFYHSLARALDNVFPESRYVSLYRFIGPMNYYPLNTGDIFTSELDDDLKYFASLSFRMLSFFTRRYEFFFKFMSLKNPYPEGLENHRFLSRKALINETFITDFRNTIIKQYHYPRPTAKERRIKASISSASASASASLSKPSDFSRASRGSADSADSFGAFFSIDFATNDLNNGNGNGNGDVDLDIDLDIDNFHLNVNDGHDDPNIKVDSRNYEILESGLLSCDYDPVETDWRDEDEVNGEYSNETISKFLKDRQILMHHFTE